MILQPNQTWQNFLNLKLRRVFKILSDRIRTYQSEIAKSLPTITEVPLYWSCSWQSSNQWNSKTKSHRGFPTNMNGQNKENKCNVEDKSAPLKRILCAPVESPLPKRELGLKRKVCLFAHFFVPRFFCQIIFRK